MKSRNRCEIILSFKLVDFKKYFYFIFIMLSVIE